MSTRNIALSVFIIILIGIRAGTTLRNSNRTAPYKTQRSDNTTITTGLKQRYAATSNQEQGYVSGGGLVSFSSELYGQEKSDILDSTLFAELTASEKYDKTENYVAWYHCYVSMLRSIGWEINSTLDFSPYQCPEPNFRISDVVLRFFTSYYRARQKEILVKLFAAWKALQDYDSRVLTFLTSSGNGGKVTDAANFQIMPAVRGQPGEVYIVFGGFFYRSHTSVHRFLYYFWESKDIVFFRSSEVARFKSSSYARYRRQVQISIERKAQSLVHAINI